MFGRIDIEHDGLFTPGTAGSAFNEAVQKIGFANFENPQSLHHLVCVT